MGNYDIEGRAGESLITLSDLDPLNCYTITGEGSGAAAGFAKGRANVKLVAAGNATILEYTAKADVGGRLAQLGGRLIDSTANKLAGDYFEKFGAIVGEPQAVEVTVSTPHEAGWLSKLFGAIAAHLKGWFGRLVGSSVASLLCLCLFGNPCCLSHALVKDATAQPGIRSASVAPPPYITREEGSGRAAFFRS